MAAGVPLNDEQRQQIHELAEDGLASRAIATRIGVGRTSVQEYLGKSRVRLKAGTGTTITTQFDQEIDDEKTLVITWAQNATPVHKGFLKALETYCRLNKAQLLVVPGRYKNPTSRWTDSQQNAQWWDESLKPYLYNQRTKLNENMMLLGDVCIQPTAIFPLSGMESLSYSESAIFPHPKLELRTVPTPHQRMPKIITTTGGVTVKNYTDTKAGKKGDFHHVFGAVVIERNGTTFYLRHLNARKDGAFCDLDNAYYPDGTMKPAGQYAGLVLGDVHVGAQDHVVLNATFNALVPLLNPKTIVLHDLFDAYTVNPHHLNNPFLSVAKRQAGKDNVRREITAVLSWLRKYITGGREAVVVPSNHNDMLARWMSRQDWREDPENAEYYLETALYMIRNLTHDHHGTAIPDPFVYWIDKEHLSGVRCLRPLESYMIKGIECGLHGHQGPNGSRGNLYNLSRLGVKVISGHSHTPGIEAGHYKTGTMTPLQLEYTGPVSSWLNAHVSVDPMGKRHLHVCVDGRFWKDGKRK